MENRITNQVVEGDNTPRLEHDCGWCHGLDGVANDVGFGLNGAEIESAAREVLRIAAPQVQ